MLNKIISRGRFGVKCDKKNQKLGNGGHTVWPITWDLICQTYTGRYGNGHK